MINLEIVTPEKKVVEREVDSVYVPTEKGIIGIMPNHAPLISALRSGVLSYNVGNESDKMVVSGGFVEISQNKVSVLADIAESQADFDLTEAQQEYNETQKLLGEWKGNEEDFELELERLEKAQARLELASGK